MKNHYQILGVEPGCSQAEIKKAYRLLAVQYHPDKNNGDSLSEERFKEISESYIILGDAVKRDAYDYACGYQKKYKAPTSASGHTPTGILLLFKKIKNKIFNSGGKVNEQLLYKLVTDLLTSDTIDFLIKAEEIANNSLIIDEVLVCGIFLSDEHKPIIAEKLTALADGNPRLLKKIAVLHNKSYK